MYSVMQNLTKIKNRKILVIVAHPDDETLWFFQSIQFLKHDNEVLIFCATYSAISKRGKELTKVADSLNLKVVFGHCEDTGIDHFLKKTELQQAFIKVFSKYKIDLAITHPPHGGEKPHPHHIQLYFLTKDFSRYYSAQFSFFCEQKLLTASKNHNDLFLNLKKKKYIAYQIFQGYRSLKDKEDNLLYIIKCILSVFFSFKSFFGFETEVDIEAKQASLACFESQQDVLKSYYAYYKKSEYLYIENQ